MKRIPTPVIRGLLCAGLAAGLTGCILINIQTGNTPPKPGPAKGHDGQAKPEHKHAARAEDCCGGALVKVTDEVDPQFYEGFPPTTGNFGVVHRHTSLSTANNSTGCFKASDGWDRYFVLPGLFAGPNKTCNNAYLNTANSVRIMVMTCTASNLFWGNTLETGIVIAKDLAPNDPKFQQCRSTSLCDGNGKLTTNRYSMSAQCYRATIYYKSATLTGGQTNIDVNWNYE